jgi:hypothetical protein
LTSVEAQERLARYGLNQLKAKSRTDWLALFLAQFKSPIILILLFAAGLSLFLRDAPDAFIIISIVLVSGGLGFWQERGATDAVEKLLAIVQVRAAVLRDGKEQKFQWKGLFGEISPYSTREIWFLEIVRFWSRSWQVFSYSISLLRKWRRRCFIGGFASNLAELQKSKQRIEAQNL